MVTCKALWVPLALCLAASHWLVRELAVACKALLVLLAPCVDMARRPWSTGELARAQTVRG